MHKDGSLLKLFISYSKDDSDFKKSLLKHLASLRGNIVTWNDQDMLPGEDWDDSIKDKLRSADVVLYLVSHNSIATDYIQNVELPLIEERCKNKECVLIPVIVDFCLWEYLDFAKYNALPNKGLPVTDKSWANQNEAWLQVVQGIKRNIEKLTVESSVTQPSIIPEPKPVIIPPVLKTNEDWQIIDNYKVKEGLAIDTKTGLMWLRFDYGQSWNKVITQGQTHKASWQKAFKYTKLFNMNDGYAGYSDWRLPSIVELKTLIDNKSDYGINIDVFPNDDNCPFWSCDDGHDDHVDRAFAIAFCFCVKNNDGVGQYPKHQSLQIRLVRNNCT
jgi:hypothetical protein